MPTLTSAGDTIEPWGVLGYRDTSDSGNVIHRLVSGAVGYSLVPDAPPTGGLRLLFLTRAEAASARALLREARVWVFEDTDNPEMNMTFVRVGALEREQQDMRARWVLVVGFQEVPA